MTGWDAFNKYVGVQGILAVMLVAGYIAALFTRVPLPDAYANIMTLLLGFYFAKNGVGAVSQIISAIRGTEPVKKGRG